MRWLTLLFLMALGLSGHAMAQQASQRGPDPGAFNAAQWHDPDLGRSIRKGFADADTIWLLGESRRVVRFDRTTGARSVVAKDVADLLPDGAKLWILSDSTIYGGTLSDLRAPEAGTFKIEAKGTSVALFLTGGDRPGLLSASEIYTPTGRDGWRAQRLETEIMPYATVVSDGQGSLFLGFNRGEWGGGLRRIDIRTGAISVVTEAGDELCGGLINPDCDPVVGLLRDRDHPGCILVGVGLAHLGMTTGATYRVCRERITPVFAAPVRPPAMPNALRIPGQTGPFSSLTQVGQGWIAISDGRYFRMTSERVVERPLPPMKEWSGLRLAAEQDGAIFVMGACCWGAIDHPTQFSTLVIPLLE